MRRKRQYTEGSMLEGEERELPHSAPVTVRYNEANRISMDTATTGSSEVRKLYETKNKYKYGQRELQLWTVLKLPLLLAFCATLTLQLLAVLWITGSPYGVLALGIVESWILIRYYRKTRKGTEEERIRRELAKNKSI